MKVFALYHMKGGVGKTAGAVNLAHLSAREGHRTLLWDLDPQGAATYYFRIHPRCKGSGRRMIRGRADPAYLIRASDYEGLDVLPADFSARKMEKALSATKRPEERLARLLAPIADEYDHVYLDCAPNVSPVAESVFFAVDALLMPTIPTTLSLRTFAQLVKHLRGRKRRPRLLPFLCMVDRRKSLHRVICDWVAASAPGFLTSVIPYSSRVEQMGLHRRPLTAFAPSSAPSRAYERLFGEIAARLARDDDPRLFSKRTLRMLDLVGRQSPSDAVAPPGRAHRSTR